MRCKLWPNGLGYDVGQHEVFKMPGGGLSVRLFRDGEPWKHGRYPGLDDPKLAVEACRQTGEPFEEDYDASAR